MNSSSGGWARTRRGDMPCTSAFYQLDEVFEVLSRVFTPDEDSYDERPAGEGAVAAFVVDEDARALVNSEVLSSCARGLPAGCCGGRAAGETGCRSSTRSDLAAVKRGRHSARNKNAVPPTLRFQATPSGLGRRPGARHMGVVAAMLDE
jgi:hypothetical protein